MSLEWDSVPQGGAIAYRDVILNDMDDESEASQRRPLSKSGAVTVWDNDEDGDDDSKHGNNPQLAGRVTFLANRQILASGSLRDDVSDSADGKRDEKKGGVFLDKHHAEFLRRQEVASLNKRLQASQGKYESLAFDNWVLRSRKEGLEKALSEERQLSCELQFRVDLLDQSNNDSNSGPVNAANRHCGESCLAQNSGEPSHEGGSNPNVAAALSGLADQLSDIQDEIAASKGKKRKRSSSKARRSKRAVVEEEHVHTNQSSSSCIIL
ncbi:expressed unknown protein [Seminavis robusta]|uniref:Uncharacterized protein n=1 Tax=Seminavis robusta TaxID=568900 RepID=A0A9N8F1Q1_9STRA|nr:expressed unknown protein [Seminavis robusta]|eukprot:Sro2843_g338320.1 n/a (267) ;mRNA; f:5035-5947